MEYYSLTYVKRNLLKLINAGNIITITRYGKPIALLVPINTLDDLPRTYQRDEKGRFSSSKKELKSLEKPRDFDRKGCGVTGICGF